LGQKIIGLKKIWAEKYLGQKIFGPGQKKFGPKKIWAEKNLGQKKFGPKKIQPNLTIN